MEEIKVLYKKTKNGKVPTQGYPDDFAYDIYTSKGVLVPPLTFKSVQVETDLKMAFDPIKAGMKVSLRSGAASKTPLIVSNSPGIVEGTYRDGIKILVRNTFIDNRLVDFAFNSRGERIPVSHIPPAVLTQARRFYNDETELLEYGEIAPEVKDKVYKTHVPAGTIYVAKGDRIAQIHYQSRLPATFEPTDELPESTRGERGLGSSGVRAKEEK